MTLIILVIYFIVFCFGFRIYDLPKRTGLTFNFICILFAVKIGMGILNLYFHNSEYLYNDAHHYFLEANILLQDFAQHPGVLLQDWFFNWGEIHNHLNFLNKDNAVFWTDIGRLMHLRFMILCNVLSFGHEYVNVLFYNLFFFVGALALYKSFLHFRPDQKLVILLIIFFIPSISFWCSGIHKDGFILSMVGYASWATIKLLHNKYWKNALLLALTLFLLLAFRYFYFLVFVPFYILFWLLQSSKKVFIKYAAFSAVVLSIFLFIGTFFPRANLLKLVVNKQHEFYGLRGYSDMETPLLEATPSSFVRNFPIAVDHILIEPIPKMGQKIKYDITALDSIFILALIGFALLRIKRKYLNANYGLLIFYFSIFCLVFIGYTIPNLGALVRYESPFTCLLLLSLYSFSSITINNKLSLK